MCLFELCSKNFARINFVSESCKKCQNPTSVLNVKNRLPGNLLETNIICSVIAKKQNPELGPRSINHFNARFVRTNQVPLNGEKIWSLTTILLI